MLDSQSKFFLFVCLFVFLFFKLYLQYRGPRIIFGFRDRSNKGKMCNDMSAFSRVKEGEILLIWWVYCVVISMYREYRAVITVFAPIKIIVMLDHEKVDITMNSSSIWLIAGCRAKLVRLAKSHQVAIIGRNVCRPRARIIVRL